MKSPSLELQDVALGYSQKGVQRVILEGLNLSTESPGLCALVGRNGIGKTTLLKSAVGLIPGLSGQIRLNGKRLQEWTTRERAKQASILLNRSYSDRQLRVEELVLLGRTPYRNHWDKPLEGEEDKLNYYLELLGIDHLQGRSCLELSDGQFQKVLLARTLIQECPIVMLDEPTAHLDPYQKYQFFEVLQSLVELQGTRFLVSTHEVDLAWKFSDHWWILDGKDNRELEVDPTLQPPDLTELYAV